MSNVEMKIDALARLCLAQDEAQKTAARSRLIRLLEEVPMAPGDPESLVRRFLLELGAPEHLLGHGYMVEAVLLVVEDKTYINNITFGLYPQLAARFDTTAARVERALRNLIEVTWLRTDVDVLHRYFGNTIRGDKGKPTNSEFIARLANLVRQQMKTAA